MDREKKKTTLARIHELVEEVAEVDAIRMSISFRKEEVLPKNLLNEEEKEMYKVVIAETENSFITIFRESLNALVNGDIVVKDPANAIIKVAQVSSHLLVAHLEKKRKEYERNKSRSKD